MRIIAGKFRCARLVAPEGRNIRPTSDRVRESLFNVLAHGIEGFAFEGAQVIDLFAGTGALGLEALSRGARFCLFVEDEAEARGLIRENVEALGLTGATKIFRRDATQLGEAGKLGPFDLAFLDPPYGKGLGERALAALANGGWLRAGAICVLEERAGTAITLPEAFVVLDERRWGDTQVSLLRYQPAARSA
jgi:16S rRNA (guanine966-N2)-methyltransferase